MLNKTNAALATIALAIAPAFQAGAALITQTPNTVLDTDTNLVWYKVTETAGYSFDSLTPLFADGEAFDGYQHATNSEVASLFTHAGLNPNTFSTNAAQVAAAEFLQDLFGAAVTGNVASTYGLTANTIGSGLHDVAYIEVQNSSFTFNGVPIGLHAAANVPVAGHWLRKDNDVVSNVPEPGSLALTALGLAGLAAARRRKPAP